MGLYNDPLRALADFHTFFKLLWTFRDWHSVGEVYRSLPFPRSALYDKLQKMVNTGLMIRREDNGVVKYRVISRRIVIPDFGAIELADDSPLIYVFIDPMGDFLRRLRWRPDEVLVLVRGSNNGH